MSTKPPVSFEYKGMKLDATVRALARRIAGEGAKAASARKGDVEITQAALLQALAVPNAFGSNDSLAAERLEKLLSPPPDSKAWEALRTYLREVYAQGSDGVEADGAPTPVAKD